MSRRSRKGSKSSSNVNVVPIIIGIFIALAAVAGIVVLPKVFGKDKSPTLDWRGYLKDSRSHVGNVNTIVGTIKDRQDTDRSGETLLHIIPDDAEKEDLLLGLFVSEETRDKYPNINLEKENAYVFKIKVDKDSQLKVIEISSK